MYLEMQYANESVHINLRNVIIRLKLGENLGKLPNDSVNILKQLKRDYTNKLTSKINSNTTSSKDW